MKFIRLILLYLISINVLASDLQISGIIRSNHPNDNGKYFNFYSAKESENYFPINLYSYEIYGYDLKNLNTDHININLKDFILAITADLKLISYDKNTGEYKFLLFLYAKYLKYTGNDNGKYLMTGGEIFPNAKLTIFGGSNPVFEIEGKIQEVNGKLSLISSNSNPYFDIIIDTLGSKSIRLKLLKNVPVFFIS